VAVAVAEVAARLRTEIGDADTMALRHDGQIIREDSSDNQADGCAEPAPVHRSAWSLIACFAPPLVAMW